MPAGRWLPLVFAAVGALSLVIGAALYVSRGAETAELDKAWTAELSTTAKALDARLDAVERWQSYEDGFREGYAKGIEDAAPKRK